MAFFIGPSPIPLGIIEGMNQPNQTYLVGFGKSDMTAFVPGIGMMGYGQFHNVVKEVATPLMARAMFVRDQDRPFLLIHLEQAFVTIAIKQEVVRRLQQLHPEWQLSERTVLMTAQHTHAAPGGYSHYPFYNFTIPGFRPQVFERVCSAAVRASEMAHRDLTPSEISWGEISLHPDLEVAFNRSMRPYLNNADAPVLKLDENHLAVDRRMLGVLVKDLNGKLRGHLNWFAVHNTSVSSFNQRIHHDNKGVAAQLFERHYPGVTAFFLQTSAGDVSPNFRWDKSKRLMVGKFDDQYESAAFNGEIQFRQSETIPGAHALTGPLACHQTYLDMGVLAAPPAHGVGFFMGTLEGPGVPAPLGAVLKVVARLHKRLHLWRRPSDRSFYDKHGTKDILLDHRSGTFAGIKLSAWKKFPPLPDPTVEAVRLSAKKESINTLPWVPQVIPFQLVRLGDLLLVALPGEITTHASKRLVAQLELQSKGLSITKIIVTTYANGYMGYITTPEEYDLQAYEGGHTVYGRHTLDGIIQGCLLLVEQLRLKDERASLLPAFQFPLEELQRRTL